VGAVVGAAVGEFSPGATSAAGSAAAGALEGALGNLFGQALGNVGQDRRPFECLNFSSMVGSAIGGGVAGGVGFGLESFGLSDAAYVTGAGAAQGLAEAAGQRGGEAFASSRGDGGHPWFQRTGCGCD
jgi:hypothetical protein